MNCKQGDRFIIIKGVDAGKIGICEYLASEEEVIEQSRAASGQLIAYLVEKNFWKINFLKAWRDTNGVPYKIHYISDCLIRPLRDTDEEDEMLRVVGKPTVVGNSTVVGKPKEKENIE